MSIDYAEAKRLHTLHKRRLTIAKRKGPEAVIASVADFYAAFEEADIPYPDDWRHWANAEYDALLTKGHAGQ